MPKRLLAIPRIRLAVYLVFLTLIIVGLYELAEDTGLYNLDRHSIENFIAHTGIFSYVIYTALVALFALTPIASSSLWLVAGYLFAPSIAIALTILAEILGSIGNFYIGKQIIAPHLSDHRWPRLAKTIKNYTRLLNAPMIFVLGLIPVSTTNVTAYAASLSGMPFRQYIVPWIGGVGTLATLTILLGHSASLHAPLLSIAIILVAIALFLLVRVAMRHNSIILASPKTDLDHKLNKSC